MAVRGAQLYTMRDHLKDANAFANTIDRPYDPAAATVDQINLVNHRPKR